MNRRGFLQAILAAAAAPALAQANSLMRVVPVRQGHVWYLHSDGLTDDTAAINALFRGETVIDRATGFHLPNRVLQGGIYRVTDTIVLGDNCVMSNARVSMDFCHEPTKPMLRFSGNGSLVTGVNIGDKIRPSNLKFDNATEIANAKLQSR